MDMNEALLEDFDLLFEESTEKILSEEMSDTKVAKEVKKIKASFPYKELSKGLWGDSAAIRAAGLDVAAMRVWQKKYAAALKTFNTSIAPKNMASAKAAEYMVKAKVAKKELKSMYGKVVGFEKKISKGTAKAAGAKGKAVVGKINTKVAAEKAKAVGDKKVADAAIAKKAAAKKKRDGNKVAKAKAAIAADKKAKKDAFIGKVKGKVAKINFVSGK